MGVDRASSGSVPGDPPPVAVEPARQARAGRREALLDAVATMVAAGGVEDVSMETVADLAGVSRALVYKHFPNRRELLSALYERESAQLHARIANDVAKARGLEGMLRALVAGSLDAQASRGATFAAIGQSGGLPGAQREIQRRRDGRTLRFFTRQAVVELALEERQARTALAVALASIGVVLAQWRRRPTPEHALLLQETYVSMTMGGLRSLAGRDGG